MTDTIASGRGQDFTARDQDPLGPDGSPMAHGVIRSLMRDAERSQYVIVETGLSNPDVLQLVLEHREATTRHGRPQFLRIAGTHRQVQRVMAALAAWGDRE